jgi:hypothetical protein
VKTSPDIGELSSALAVAQGAMKGAVKDASNPFFNSKYADLQSVWDACREPLTKNGLAVIQFPKCKSYGEPVPYEYEKKGEKRMGVKVVYEVSVLTRLVHKSGQWMEDRVSTLLPHGDPQAVGSAITYLRRYALQSVAGIAPEDDDGNGSGDHVTTTSEDVQPARKVRDTGLPPCPVCETNAKVIKSKFGPGFYCLKSRTKFDPVAEQADTDPQAESYAEQFE